jgi:hypothetical protein
MALWSHLSKIIVCLPTTHSIAMVTISVEVSPSQPHHQGDDKPVASIKEGSITQRAVSDASSTCPTVATTTTTSLPLSLSEQDHVVFGSINHDLTDFLAARIEHTIQQTVMEGLPLLDDGPPKMKLQQTLVYKFVRNIDVLEAYCAENILTLRKYHPSTRKRIVQVLQQGEVSLEDVPYPRNDSGRRDKCTDSIIPTKDMIPSSTASKSLQDELENLHERLKAARSARDDLLVQQKSLARAQSFISLVMQVLELHKPMVDVDGSLPMVSHQVDTVVTDGHSVHELIQEAQTILNKINRPKRPSASQSQNDDNGLEDDSVFYQTLLKHPRLSLEEKYKRDLIQLGLLRDTTNQETRFDDGETVNASKLKALKKMLKSKPTIR